jgi:hypothetical protein
VRGTDNLTAFMCRLSLDLGASTLWNPQALSGRTVQSVHKSSDSDSTALLSEPVQGVLYILTTCRGVVGIRMVKVLVVVTLASCLVQIF